MFLIAVSYDLCYKVQSTCIDRGCQRSCVQHDSQDPGRKERHSERKTLEEKNVILNEINGEPDHVHLLITCGPELSPLEIANVLKTRSARFVWRDLPDEVAKTFWDKEKHLFWSRSYFVSTVGAANEEAIKHYIQNQGN